MRTVAMCVLSLLMTSTVVAQSSFDPADVPGPQRIGEEVRLYIESGRIDNAAGEVVWSERLDWPGAIYIAPHFSAFDLPPGAELVVRAPDHSRSWTYTGYGKADHFLDDGFWGIHIPGDVAIIELRSKGPVRAGAVAIDAFAYGDPELANALVDRSLCGTNDVDEAKCYQNSHPAVYAESQAVARLVINGCWFCTGWLVGSEGHLMTNEHCITSASDALNTNYEFMAEGSSCSTNCQSGNACGGTVVATSATLTQLDAPLDYALVELPTNPTATYGYMQLRSSGPRLGEQITIPGHPAGWGKQFAIESTHPQNPAGLCQVDTLTAPGCGNSIDEVGYYCDTQGGSSGSPVLANVDNCVVALHHCKGDDSCTATGGDHNRGVPIQDIIDDLGSNLPADALCGSGSDLEIVYGRETIDEVTRTVLIGGMTDARVVMGPVSLEGSDPATIRLGNVSDTSFQHTLQEWDYLNGTHNEETASWLALPDGASTIGGLDAEAGDVSVDEAWVTVSFAQTFSAAPVVLATVTTTNGTQAVAVRLRNVTSSSFQIRLQEEEANDDNHAFETVHWVAMETGTATVNGDDITVARTVNVVTDGVYLIGNSVMNAPPPFDANNPVFLAEMQTFNGSDPATVRYVGFPLLSGFFVLIDEETSQDTETGHAAETVGYIIINRG
ncbi:MAG: trypsin-like peptidase domain-containing protein [Acidobacteriota bacterium]